MCHTDTLSSRVGHENIHGHYLSGITVIVRPDRTVIIKLARTVIIEPDRTATTEPHREFEDGHQIYVFIVTIGQMVAL